MCGISARHEKARRGGCRAGGGSADKIRNDRGFLSRFLPNLQLSPTRKYERAFSAFSSPGHPGEVARVGAVYSA